MAILTMCSGITGWKPVPQSGVKNRKSFPLSAPNTLSGPGVFLDAMALLEDEG
jgi:hypothetical protein